MAADDEEELAADVDRGSGCCTDSTDRHFQTSSRLLMARGLWTNGHHHKPLGMAMSIALREHHWTNRGHHNSEADDSGGSSCSRDLDTARIHGGVSGTLHRHAENMLEDATSYRELRRQESLVRRTCSFCGKVCPKPSDLQRHLMKHTGERPFGCEACGRKFKAKRSLQYHMRAAHGAMVELSPGLQEKLEGVANPRRRPRCLPSEELIPPLPLAPPPQHVPADVTNVLVPKPETDDKEEDAASATYRQASLILGLLQSGLLLNPALHSSCFQAPIRQVPDIPRQQSPESPEDRESQVFSVASLKDTDGRTPEIVKYRVHPRSEEIIATRLEGVNIVTGEKAFLYKCHWCSKIFLTLGKLQSHLTVHSRRSRKSYTCSKCGEVFKLRTQFRLHQVTHFDAQSLISTASSQEVAENPMDEGQEQEGDPWVLSEDCDSTDSRQPRTTPEDTDARMGGSSPSCSLTTASFSPCDALQELRVHDEILRHGYRCGICGKTFDRPFSLHRHERIHTGIKPCFCKDCGRGFSEPRNLRHHIIRFHSDGSQRHLLRRNRGGGITSGGIVLGGGRAMSQPKAMVSLLREHRRTFSQAVLAEEQGGKDEVDMKVEPGQEIWSTLVKAELGSSSSHDEDCEMKIPKEELEGLDDVTVIFPTAVPEISDGMVTDGGASITKCGDVDEDNVDSGQLKENGHNDNTAKEILMDPRRSLMGNRRKLKPRKMVYKVCF